MTPPTVSVIMATYNGAALVGETVESVLAQSFGDFELVIVDDASSDDTLARLRAFDDSRITIIPAERNGGPVLARNRAFAAARGRYIAGLDQDDLCHPDRLAKQVAWLEAHPDGVLVASAVRVLMADGSLANDESVPAHTSPALLRWLLHFGNPLTWSSVMIRGEAARQLDMFERPDRLYAEDFDLYHRLSRLGAMARLDEPLLTYRWHEGGASRRYTERMTASAVAVLAEAYQPLFGEGSSGAAEQVIHLVGGSERVRGTIALKQFAHIVERIHRHCSEAFRFGPDDLAMIEREFARVWWRIADRAVRSGGVSLKAALSARPAGASLQQSRPARMMMSGMIGQVRARGWLSAS
jgi:hypothetical protein